MGKTDVHLYSYCILRKMVRIRRRLRRRTWPGGCRWDREAAAAAYRRRPSAQSQLEKSSQSSHGPIGRLRDSRPPCPRPSPPHLYPPAPDRLSQIPIIGVTAVDSPVLPPSLAPQPQPPSPPLPTNVRNIVTGGGDKLSTPSPPLLSHGSTHPSQPNMAVAAGTTTTSQLPTRSRSARTAAVKAATTTTTQYISLGQLEEKSTNQGDNADEGGRTV